MLKSFYLVIFMCVQIPLDVKILLFSNLMCVQIPLDVKILLFSNLMCVQIPLDVKTLVDFVLSSLLFCFVLLSCRLLVWWPWLLVVLWSSGHWCWANKKIQSIFYLGICISKRITYHTPLSISLPPRIQNFHSSRII